MLFRLMKCNLVRVGFSVCEIELISRAAATALTMPLARGAVGVFAVSRQQARYSAFFATNRTKEQPMIAMVIALATFQAPPWPVTTPGFRPCEEYAVSEFGMPQYRRCRATAAELDQRVASRAAELTSRPDQAGCLGKDEATCIATLARMLAVTSFVANDVGIVPDTSDINGQPVRHMVILAALTPMPPGSSEPGRAGMHLTVDGATVTAVYVGLPENPLLAHTEADWDRTRVYELTRAVLGDKCVPETRLAFYRHIDAGIRAASSIRSYQGGPDPTISHDRSATERRCGFDFNFGATGGENASQGAFGGGTLMFTIPGTR